MGENILEYKGYYTKILYSVKDHVLYGKIEGIRDLVNFESESIENIEQEFHSAVDDYLAFCEDLGQSPEKAYNGVFNVRITPELHREAAIAADKNNETLNSFVANAISQAIHGNTPTVIYSFTSDVTNAFKTIATTRKTRTAAYVGN